MGGGYKEPWGTLKKLREYKDIMGITRLPSPLGPPPLEDILTIGDKGIVDAISRASAFPTCQLQIHRVYGLTIITSRVPVACPKPDGTRTRKLKPPFLP